MIWTKAVRVRSQPSPALAAAAIAIASQAGPSDRDGV